MTQTLMMRAYLLLLRIALVLLVFGCRADTPSSMKLHTLSQSLVAGEIASIELLHISYDTKTRTRIDIELLEKMTSTAQAKCALALSSQISADLKDIVSELVLEPTSRAPDLRWGVRFIDSSNVAKYAIYLDGRSMAGTGTHGLVDARAFNVRGRLVNWLESALASHCPSIPL